MTNCSTCICSSTHLKVTHYTVHYTVHYTNSLHSSLHTRSLRSWSLVGAARKNYKWGGATTAGFLLKIYFHNTTLHTISTVQAVYLHTRSLRSWSYVYLVGAARKSHKLGGATTAGFLLKIYFHNTTLHTIYTVQAVYLHTRSLRSWSLVGAARKSHKLGGVGGG